MNKYLFKDIVLGKEGLLKGPFGSDLKKELYVSKSDGTYKVYLQENILKEDNSVGEHYISEEYYHKKMFRYTVNENDFIVTCDGTLGEIFQLKNLTERGIISSSLLRITLNPGIVDYNYFYYYFKYYIKNALIKKGNNSVLKHLPGLGIIRQFELYLPDLKVQKEIGSNLKIIDDKIHNNSEIIEELEKISKTIFDYWFLQFEFPDEYGKTYKTNGGKMIWNSELKKNIPEGWKALKVNDVLLPTKSNCKILKSEYLTEGLFPIIDQSKEYICGYTNLKTESVFFDDCVVFGDHTKILKYVNFSFNRGADGTKILNSKVNELSNYLLYLQLKNIQLPSQGYSRYFKFLKDKYVIIPSKKINDDFQNKIKDFLVLISNLRVENQKLQSLKKFLLPLLMNRQIKSRL